MHAVCSQVLVSSHPHENTFLLLLNKTKKKYGNNKISVFVRKNFPVQLKSVSRHTKKENKQKLRVDKRNSVNMN